MEFLKRLDSGAHWFARLREGSYAVALVGLAIGAAFVFRRLPHANLSLLFLMVVLVIAARWGLWLSIFASVLSFLALNFLFTPPYYTLAVEEQGDFATLLFFLAMAALTGNLAARMRSEMAASQTALARVTGLLDFSRRMAAARNADEARQALVDQVSASCDARAVILAAEQPGIWQLTAQAGIEPERLPEWIGSQDTQRGAPEPKDSPLPKARGWTFFPWHSNGGARNVVGIEEPSIDSDQQMLLAGFCDQASVAIERAALVDRLRDAQLATETERLRAALLSSVSHDLRTPLVSIIGATTSLLEYRSILKLEDRQELLRTVLDEAQRLNRYIQNLLDMTRFGQPPFELKREWIDINDLISSAADRLGSTLDGIQLAVRVNSDTAFLKVQGTLVEQMLVNLLDNAASFTPDGSVIAVEVRQRGGDVIIEVSNDGPVIPENEREKIFDMFYRATLGDRKRAGTGLGLAICRSIANAHGGEITANTRADGTGAMLKIILPTDLNPCDGSQP